MFRTLGKETRRAGSALAVTALLVSVLFVLTASAVAYFLSSLNGNTDAMADMRAFYAAEAARAAAFAHVVQNPAETSYDSGLCTLSDNAAVSVAEYSYAVTDITLPEQNQRRRVRVHAYWPSQSEAQAHCQLTFYMELSGESWTMISYTRDS